MFGPERNWKQWEDGENSIMRAFKIYKLFI
jgi:hypothetical protein